MDPSSEISTAASWQPGSNSKLITHPANVAATVCNSDLPQVMAPAWGGTFASNSPDGVYPSQTRSCTWTLQALSNGTGVGTGGNDKNPIPYVIAVNFTTPIQLVCGMDYLTFYDGADTTAPVLARICGNIWQNRLPTIYSTGSLLTVVFSSQEQSPGSYGFTATWASIAPCSVCVPEARGTCSSTNMCNCYNRYSGAVCEQETAGFKDFTPRSQHAMAFDSTKDMVYIMGGTSLRNPFMWDLLTYTFATNKWGKITINTRSPDPRYGHFAFMYNGDLYVYGGVSVIGGLADVWKFNGKVWMQQHPINPEKPPVGRAGSACVVVSDNNSTKLYVFGGLDVAGVATRDLNVYDINLAMWKRSDHQNSVGLAGATAVYHQATDSIYYFGGMVNQTTRNVITYQYRISQDLWYALAPRIDPLTATPVPQWNGSLQDPPPYNISSEDSESGDDPDGDGDIDDSTVQYLPPVMYDPVTAVWSPATLMGDDSVVIYGACQKWSSFDTSDLDTAIKSRVNHTMILRPPGAAGGSKTAWMAYIFGGFDGSDHADMLNVTMNVSIPVSGNVNNCRALRWCSLYDDCQNCNSAYCSYVNGLCLFDTDKAKSSAYLLGSSADIPKVGTLQDLIRQRPELKAEVLATPDACPTRITLDLRNPFSGSIQSGQELTFKIYVDLHDLDLQFEIRTLPTSALDFKSLNVWESFMNMYWRADHGLTDNSYNGIWETSAPIPLDVQVTADNVTLGDYALISSTGVLNTSELMNRWSKYSGLDASPTMSAKKDNTSYIYFPAADPRRFSGYYVFSLTNRNPTALSFSVTVTPMDHPPPVEKPVGTQFNMATLGFFTLGFIVAVVLLIILARKIRQLIEDRDASHRAAEMQLLEDEEEERSRNGNRLRGGMSMVQMDGTTLQKKPIYRIVVGVQDLGKHISAISGATLRQRVVRGRDNTIGGTGNKIQGNDKHMPRSQSESVVSQTVEQSSQPLEQTRVRSDFIRDIGSTPLPLLASVTSTGEEETRMDADSSVYRASSFEENFRRMVASTPDLTLKLDSSLIEDNKAGTEDANPHGKLDLKQQDNATPGADVQRGWSLKRLSRVTSFKRNQKSHNEKNASEEQARLTSQGLVEEDEDVIRHSSGSYDSEQEVMDLGILSSHTDLFQKRQEQLDRYQLELEQVKAVGIAEGRRRRNPIKVQPLSVEPLPFDAGLVPRTLSNLRQYQRHLAREQRRQQQELLNQHNLDTASGGLNRDRLAERRIPSCHTLRSTNSTNSSSGSSSNRPPSRNHPTTSLSALQRLQPRQVRASRSQGSLKEVHKIASRIALRTNVEALYKDRGDEKVSPIKLDSGMHRTRTSPLLPLPQQQRRGFSHHHGQQQYDLETDIELRPMAASTIDKMKSGLQGENALSTLTAGSKRKPIKMRGRQEYEPGPLLGMNFLIVFPGDVGSRRVRQQGDCWRETGSEGTGSDAQESSGQDDEEKEANDSCNDDTLYNTEMRLPPMAIGTVFVPDPVRWWAYKAKQVLDRKKFERQMRRMHRRHKEDDGGENGSVLQPLQPAKTR
ncbi:hypothetical protein EDD11_007488 [Mortierella claussenii]|nr:hypothetical protein EDD11_007488 [Mortierella claussenii]